MLAAWIYGSVARGEDRPDSDIDIAVVAVPAERNRVVDAMRQALVAPAATSGFVPAVVGLDLDDIGRLSCENDPWWISLSADAVVLLGARPENLAASIRGIEAAA